MPLERFFLALIVAVALLLVFVIAVREGRFASHTQRKLVVAAIVVAAFLIWLVPFPAR